MASALEPSDCAGELLYLKVEPLVLHLGHRAGTACKVTGMLLELPVPQVQHLLADAGTAALQAKVLEAVQVLCAHGWTAPGPGPAASGHLPPGPGSAARGHLPPGPGPAAASKQGPELSKYAPALGLNGGSKQAAGGLGSSSSSSSNCISSSSSSSNSYEAAAIRPVPLPTGLSRYAPELGAVAGSGRRRPGSSDASLSPSTPCAAAAAVAATAARAPAASAAAGTSIEPARDGAGALDADSLGDCLSFAIKPLLEARGFSEAWSTKVTSMLMELGVPRVQALVSDSGALQAKVKEGIDLLLGQSWSEVEPGEATETSRGRGSGAGAASGSGPGAGSQMLAPAASMALPDVGPASIPAQELDSLEQQPGVAAEAARGRGTAYRPLLMSSATAAASRPAAAVAQAAPTQIPCSMSGGTAAPAAAAAATATGVVSAALAAAAAAAAVASAVRAPAASPDCTLAGVVTHPPAWQAGGAAAGRYNPVGLGMPQQVANAAGSSPHLGHQPAGGSPHQRHQPGGGDGRGVASQLGAAASPIIVPGAVHPVASTAVARLALPAAASKPEDVSSWSGSSSSSRRHSMDPCAAPALKGAASALRAAAVAASRPPDQVPHGAAAALPLQAEAAAGLSRKAPEPGRGAPPYLQCPILCRVMRDPVITLDGHTYERAAIEEWLAKNCTSPMTGLALEAPTLIPNRAIRDAIDAWKQAPL